MAGHHLITADEPDTILVSYLADLGTRLHGPRPTRAVILAEIRDGLDQATTDHAARGLGPADAAATAVEQFGSPQAVADAFTGELATAYARRTITTFVLTGPLVGIWWLLLLHPRPWRSTPAALIAAIPAVPLIAVAGLCVIGDLTVLTTLATGGPTPPSYALTAVAVGASLTRIACSITVIRSVIQIRGRHRSRTPI